MNPEHPQLEHERFEYLCMLSTVGELTDAEARELKSHVASCETCQKELSDCEQFVKVGMPYLASEFASTEEGNSDGARCAWDLPAAKSELFGRIAPREPVRTLQSAKVRIRTKWVASAAAALLAAGLLLAFVYQRGQRSGRREVAAVLVENRSLRERLESLVSEKRKVDGALTTRENNIQELSAAAQQQTEELDQLRKLAEAKQSANDSLTLENREQSTMLHAASGERDLLAQKLDDTEKALHQSEAQLASARAERQRDLLRMASLETEIRTVSAHLEDRNATVSEQQTFLASDRDIRELMGARDLYIADVFDVDGTGTNKPFGRVFYTQNKSLIFYAFDLDQQPHLKTASNFQAWGRRGVSDKSPLNLGIFYMDNLANRRWMLKFDDPSQLSQVDAVFVTVEPHGGSKKPSGKQLLFASIKGIANHP